MLPTPPLWNEEHKERHQLWQSWTVTKWNSDRSQRQRMKTEKKVMGRTRKRKRERPRWTDKNNPFPGMIRNRSSYTPPIDFKFVGFRIGRLGSGRKRTRRYAAPKGGCGLVWKISKPAGGHHNRWNWRQEQYRISTQFRLNTMPHLLPCP